MSNIVHASCVAFDKRGILILGASGTGKSGLAIGLLALGASLISDDKTILTEQSGLLVAQCPTAIKGMIEVRGVGLLAAEAKGSAIVTLVIDLDRSEPDRLPPHRTITQLGLEVDVIYGKDTRNLAAAIKLLMQGGRIA